MRKLLLLVAILILTACNPASGETDGEWKTFTESTLGVSIDYPGDGTIEAEGFHEKEIPFGEAMVVTEKFILKQTTPGGNQVHIERTKDEAILEHLQHYEPFKEKTINGLMYKEFHFTEGGEAYGYLIERGEYFYYFVSVQGPSNETFEHMMTTVEFK